MPWYAKKDVSGSGSWHWTMNHFDQEQKKRDDQRMIGLYDSGHDQALLMKHTGHQQTTLHELDGFDHGKMPEPAFPLLLRFLTACHKSTP